MMLTLLRRRVWLLALDPTVQRKSGTELRFVWLLNPKLTVIIPKHQLDAQPGLQMAVSIYRVMEDGSRRATRRFERPRTYSHRDLTAGSTVYKMNTKFIDDKNDYYGRRIEIFSP